MFGKNAKRLSGVAFCMLCLCFLIFIASPPGLAEDGQTLVYVSGNPDLYPVEFYDEEEKKYQGLIPELLEAFSASSAYRVEYLSGASTDNRREKNANRQAELISGCVLEDGFEQSQWQAGITVMRAAQDGQEKEYRILFTELADEALRQELSAFFAGVTEQERNGIIFQTVQQDTRGIPLWILMASGAAALLLAVGIAIVLVCRCRKRLKDVRLKLETDEITGIGNREYFARQFRQMLGDKNRALYDIVYFQAGADPLFRFRDDAEENAFFAYIASVLNGYTGRFDILARVANEGFALLKFSASPGDVEQWLPLALKKIREYPNKSNTPVPIRICAGYYRLHRADRDFNGALSKAKYGCAYAHENGLDYAGCTQRMIDSHEEEASLQKHVQTALDNGEFEVYLHFFVDASCGKIVGAEALSRWNHPEKGILMPDKFIPMMEREKSISNLDYYVLERVCQILEERTKEDRNGQDAAHFFISCNFSRSTFASADFVENCWSIIQRYQFPRGELILELTEGNEAIHLEAIYQNAIHLRKYGIKIALDDFGNSLCEFHDLGKYQFNGLKLDKGLIYNIHSREGAIILEEIIHMGQRLGMTVLAEGVETKEQAEKLKEMGCPILQGFYFYPPLPLGEAKRIYLSEAPHSIPVLWGEEGD